MYNVFNAAMKKLKHRLVEKMKESTADTLGITRAVLVNGKIRRGLCTALQLLHGIINHNTKRIEILLLIALPKLFYMWSINIAGIPGQCFYSDVLILRS